jgi:small GTP-binding protein
VPTPLVTDCAQIDGVRTLLHLWDTTGSVRLSKITHAYYRVAQAICVCYDASSPAALEGVGVWLRAVREYASGTAVVVLVGTKWDLLTSDAERSRLQALGDRIAQREGISHHTTSSATGAGVEKAFATAVREARGVRKKGHAPSIAKRGSDQGGAKQQVVGTAEGKENSCNCVGLTRTIEVALADYCSLANCCMSSWTWLRAAKVTRPLDRPALIRKASERALTAV